MPKVKTLSPASVGLIFLDNTKGLGPLTKSEEQEISEFIKGQKLLRAKKPIRRTRTTARTRVTA